MDLCPDHYIDARDPTPAQTDFFTVTRMDSWGVSTGFMCILKTAEKLIPMDYDNLAVKETTIGRHRHTGKAVAFLRNGSYLEGAWNRNYKYKDRRFRS